MKKLKKLPEFRSEDEERDFWATHSFLDYYDIKEFKRVPPASKKQEAVTLHMPADMSREVERLSQDRKRSIEDVALELLAVGLKHQHPQPGA